VSSDASDTLKAALERLVRAHGLPSCDCSVQILVFGNGRSTYVVRPAEACRVILASQLGCITGRVFLPTEPTFVLFEESLPMILGAADSLCGSLRWCARRSHGQGQLRRQKDTLPSASGKLHSGREPQTLITSEGPFYRKLLQI